MNKLTAGWLAGSFVAALAAASPACAQRPPQQPTPPTAAPPTQTAAQRMFGDVNPKLAQLTDDVLFGDVWARPGLSPRDRSLVTMSALIAMNRPDQLRSHLQRARQRPDRSRTRRSDHPSGLLCGLAERCGGERRGQGRVPEEMSRWLARRVTCCPIGSRSFIVAIC